MSTETIRTFRDREPRMATWTFTQRVQVQCCFMSTETIRTIKDEDPRTATWTFTQRVQVQCCFMSTETIRTIRDEEPRTATWTFTQLLSSDSVTCSTLLHVHRDHKDCYGRGAQDGHLDFHTAPELFLVVTV